MPTLAALFMQAPKHRESRASRFTDGLIKGYDRALRWALDHQRSMLGVFMLSVVLSVASFMMIPKGFFPLQDTAFVMGFTQAAADISYEEMVAKHKQLEAIISRDPAVISYNHGVGGAASDSIGNGRMWLVLSDPDSVTQASAKSSTVCVHNWLRCRVFRCSCARLRTSTSARECRARNINMYCARRAARSWRSGRVN